MQHFKNIFQMNVLFFFSRCSLRCIVLRNPLRMSKWGFEDENAEHVNSLLIFLDLHGVNTVLFFNSCHLWPFETAHIHSVPTVKLRETDYHIVLCMYCNVALRTNRKNIILRNILNMIYAMLSFIFIIIEYVEDIYRSAKIWIFV